MTIESYLLEHGISDETIKKFGLLQGNHQKYGDQLVFPVKDIDNNFLFNKYRNLNWVKGGETPKFIYDAGSSAQLYNLSAIKDTEYAFLFEGEPDVWKASEDHIPAICSTSGAATFEEPWIEALSGKKVLICYDNDSAGKEGTKKILEMLPDALAITLPEGVKDYCEFRQKYSLKDFQLLIGKIIKENTITYDEFMLTIDKWLLLPDKNVLKVLFSSVVSHHFASDPLWMFLVAPPSGTKTELVTLLDALPITYMLSSLTTKTLFSGFNNKEGIESASLLVRVPNTILALKDFTTVLSMRSDEKEEILGQLREVYDGKFDKALGNKVEVHWKGRVTLVAGVTGIIDGEKALMKAMGERFIMYRIVQPNDIEVAKRALHMTGQEKEMRLELRVAMRKFFWGIKIPKISDIELPEEILNTTASLAAFTVKARSGIPRNSYGSKEIDYVPAPEAPSRFAKQLLVLMKGLATIDKRKIVTWDDYYLALRVALDSIFTKRIGILNYLMQNPDFPIETHYFAQAIEFHIPGTLNILEDLYVLGLLKRNGNVQGQRFTWELSEKCLSYFKDLLTHEDINLKKYFPLYDVYSSMIDFIIQRFIKNEKDENKDL